MSVRRLSGWLLLAVAVIVAGAMVLGTVRNPEHRELTPEARVESGLTFAELPSGVTHYQLGGPVGGQPVVLVHGFSVPLYIYDSTFAALTSAGFRVLRYDLLGRGWSDRPRLDYTADLFDAQLVQLLDHLEWERPVDLVGLSMGGWIVATFGTRHPERVRSVTLIDPAAGERAPLGVFAWPVVGPWYWQTFQVPKMAEGQRGDFVDPDQFPDWVERYRPQMELRGFGQALHSTVRALAAVDFDSVYAEYGRQGIRTLLIWGTEDATVPISRRASVQAGIPSLTYVPIASAGHLPHLERADTVNTVLLNFLRPGLADSAARASALEVARSVMATARYATLVTVGPGGHPQARVMDPFAPDSAFVIRLGTNARSRKVAEIARDPRVTLLYLDAAGQSYVTVIGRAELVRDLEERRSWWKPEWAAFYTGGNLGDDYLLIRVRPERLELSSERHGLLNDAVTWRPVIVELP